METDDTPTIEDVLFLPVIMTNYGVYTPRVVLDFHVVLSPAMRIQVGCSFHAHPGLGRSQQDWISNYTKDTSANGPHVTVLSRYLEQLRQLLRNSPDGLGDWAERQVHRYVEKLDAQQRTKWNRPDLPVWTRPTTPKARP